MTSLVPYSLDYLADQVTLYSQDSDTALRNIAERSILFRDRARFGNTNEDFTEKDFVQVELKCDVVGGTECPLAPEIVSNFSDAAPSSSGALPPIPVLDGVDPDVLRNLLMSWFYTGYYTAKAEQRS